MRINYPAASSGVLYVMPDLIRHPVRFLDVPLPRDYCPLRSTGVRRNDGNDGDYIKVDGNAGVVEVLKKA